MPHDSPLSQLIRRRRMTRSFTDQPIDRADLEAMLDVARRAPSAGYSQGVHFLVLSSASLELFWDTTGAREWFEEHSAGILRAPTMVLPLADPVAYTSRYAEADKEPYGLADAAAWPIPFWLTDAAMAAQQLLLLAEEAHIGALFFGIFRNEEELLAALGVPPGIRAIGAVALGYRAADDRQSGSARTRPRKEPLSVIHHDRW